MVVEIVSGKVFEVGWIKSDHIMVMGAVCGGGWEVGSQSIAIDELGAQALQGVLFCKGLIVVD